MVTLLDDMLREIVETKKITESMIEEGIVEPLQPKTITTERILVTTLDPSKPWFGIKIWNDGPSDVWVIVNARKLSQPQKIEANDWWGVDFKTAIIDALLLYTEEGETSVRITGVR